MANNSDPEDGFGAAVPPLFGVFGVCVSSLLSAHPALAAAPAQTAPAPDTAAAAADLQQVTVTGVRSLIHDKLDNTAQDTPQSVSVVSHQTLGAQADTRLEEALKNVPGITLNAGEGAARGDTVNLRGFSAFNDFFLDGVRDAAVYTRDSFDLDSVEVLKGPSAVLFGRGSTGGAINQVTKAPLLTTLATVNTEFGSNDLYRATADFNQPLSPSSALRLNLMGEDSHLADRDLVRNRHWGIAPALAFGIGGYDSLTLAFLHQQQNDIPDVGLPFIDGRPASVPPVPRDGFFGLASDRNTAIADIFTARYRHAFSDDMSIADTFRWADYRFTFDSDMPNFGKSVPAPGTPLTAILLGRDAPASTGQQSNLDDQLDATARFNTGFVSHALVAGIEVARQISHLGRYNNPFNSNNGWVAETPLLAPNPYERAPAEPLTSRQDTSAPSAGLYVIDTLGLGPYVDLSGGFRYDYFDADYEQLTLTSGARLHLKDLDRLGSPRAALLIKPSARQTYYLSYGTSFDPSAEALTLTTKTAGLGPVKAQSYEAGTRLTWLGGVLQFTGALFRTEVDNAQTNDPDNPTLTVLDGTERVDGLELGLTGHLSPHWEIVSGYAYLDGRTVKSGTAADVGKDMPNAAHNAFNLWTEYRLSSAWEIGGGGNWLGYRYADSAEAAYVPGYVVWNAMAQWRVSPALELQLNAFNLFDKLYYDGLYYTSAAENHAIPGPGRSVALTLHMSL